MKTTAQKIIDRIVGFDDWLEKNKLEFIKKNNPSFYQELLTRREALTNKK